MSYILALGRNASEWQFSVNMMADLYRTIISLLAMIIIYAILRFAIKRNIADLQKRYRWRTRLFYSMLTLFILIVLKIWVVGLQQIFTFLGLILAAVAFTQKESLTCIVGFALIYSRKLFKVGQRVKLGSYLGDVNDISLFHTSLMECDSSVSGDQLTGRVVKVPNSNILTAGVINYEEPFPFVWGEFAVVLTANSNIAAAQTLLLNLITPITQGMYADAQRHVEKYAVTHFVTDMNLKTQLGLTIKQDKPTGITLTARYLCRVREEKLVKSQLTEAFIKATLEHPDIQLSLAA